MLENTEAATKNILSRVTTKLATYGTQNEGGKQNTKKQDTTKVNKDILIYSISLGLK